MGFIREITWAVATFPLAPLASHPLMRRCGTSARTQVCSEYWQKLSWSPQEWMHWDTGLPNEGEAQPSPLVSAASQAVIFIKDGLTDDLAGIKTHFLPRQFYPGFSHHFMNSNKSLGSLWQVDAFKSLLYPWHSANLTHPEVVGRTEYPAKIWGQVIFKHCPLKLQT